MPYQDIYSLQTYISNNFAKILIITKFMHQNNAPVLLPCTRYAQLHKNQGWRITLFTFKTFKLFFELFHYYGLTNIS